MAFARDAGPRHTSEFPPRLWFLVYLDGARPRERFQRSAGVKGHSCRASLLPGIDHPIGRLLRYPTSPSMSIASSPPRASTLTLLIPALLPSLAHVSRYSFFESLEKCPRERRHRRRMLRLHPLTALNSTDLRRAVARRSRECWVKVNRGLTDSSSLRSIRAEKPDRVFKNAQRSTNQERNSAPPSASRIPARGF